MTPENYSHNVSPYGAAASYEEQLLLLYDHYLLTGISSLAKAKSRFNTLLVGVGTSEDRSDEEKEQSEEHQEQEDTSEPGTFLM